MWRRRTRKSRNIRNKRFNVWRSRLGWYGLPLLGLVIGTWATLRFSLLAPEPPANPENICEIFREHTVWYDYTQATEKKWVTPIATQLAFVYYEASFRCQTRTTRSRLWRHIPRNLPPTAYGYAQVADP